MSASSSKKWLDIELSGTDDAFFDHTKGLCTRMVNLHFNLFWRNVFCSVIPFHNFDFLFIFTIILSYLIRLKGRVLTIWKESMLIDFKMNKNLKDIFQVLSILSLPVLSKYMQMRSI